MTKSINFIDLAAQQKRLNKKITNRIDKVLSHGKYIMGPEVSELEKSLANYMRVNNVISCGSGTDALVLALMAYNIGPGDIVFCPAFTFPATAESIAILGATPYFIDVEENTFNISIDSLNMAIKDIIKEDKFTMKAIIAVDLYGLPADYKSLQKVARTYNLKLISDAAQSFGATYFNKKVGSLADVTCVSFFPAKPLGCYGDGGAIITDDKLIAEKITSLRVHGKGKTKYDIDFIGLNSRLDTIQAAILLAKLEDFEWEFKKRNELADNYNNFFKKYIEIPYIPEGSQSVWAQYTLKHKDRDIIQNQLNDIGIPTMVYYPVPMHLKKAYKKFYRGKLINSENLSKEVFSIPMYPDMLYEDQKYIIENIIKLI